VNNLPRIANGKNQRGNKTFKNQITFSKKRNFSGYLSSKGIIKWQKKIATPVQNGYLKAYENTSAG
jgi:hypothetical protein